VRGDANLQVMQHLQHGVKSGEKKIIIQLVVLKMTT
jgi:hypothetical protein